VAGPAAVQDLPTRVQGSHFGLSSSCSQRLQATIQVRKRVVRLVHTETPCKKHKAAEHNEKGDFTSAIWHSERVLEYSDHAYKLAKETRTKSGEIVSL
jgi:hypothetical protein